MYRFWRNRIIDIYIMKEVLLPYLAGVAIVTVIGLSSFLFQLTDLIIVKDIPINVVLKLLFYQLPYIIVQSFPIAILFATLYGMSRLNRENEFTALRLGGISLYRLILPLIILGIVISGLTYYINEEIVPWTHHEAQNIIRINILKQPLPDVQDNVFFKGPEGRLFFVNKYKQEEGLLERIIVYELPVDEDYPVIITARSARILGNKWRLEGGIIHKYNEEG
ncbi:MAG: LptF/LptG family permease, partial [Halanaerobiales bacterium]